MAHCRRNAFANLAAVVGLTACARSLSIRGAEVTVPGAAVTVFSPTVCARSVFTRVAERRASPPPISYSLPTC
eukprot:7804577-Alexandrium_andersonii.AAC.1